MNTLRLSSAGMVVALLISTGCIYGSFDEPAEWSEARAKIGSMSAELGTGNDLEQAALAWDAALRASVGLDLIAPARHASQELGLDRAAGETGQADGCDKFVAEWPTHRRAQEYAGAGFEAMRIDSVGTTQLGVFVAASILYGDIVKRSDLIAPVLGDDFDTAMATAEDALHHMADLVLTATTARELLDAVIAELPENKELIAHELTHVVQQGSRLRSLLSDEGQVAYDELVAIAAAHQDVLDREPALRTMFSALLGTLESAGQSAETCESFTMETLEDAIRSASVEMADFAAILKTKHDTVKNSINNVR